MHMATCSVFGGIVDLQNASAFRFNKKRYWTYDDYVPPLAKISMPLSSLSDEMMNP